MGEERSLHPSGLDCVAQYQERNKLASLTLLCEGLIPNPAATRILRVDQLNHRPSWSAFNLTSSEKMRISSKASLERVPGFLETSTSLSSQPGILLFTTAVVFLLLRLGEGLSSSGPSGGEDGGRED